jgi:hypothetical protein
MFFCSTLVHRLRSSCKYLADGVHLQMVSMYHLIILRNFPRVCNCKKYGETYLPELFCIEVEGEKGDRQIKIWKRK